MYEVAFAVTVSITMIAVGLMQLSKRRRESSVTAPSFAISVAPPLGSTSMRFEKSHGPADVGAVSIWACERVKCSSTRFAPNTRLELSSGTVEPVRLSTANGPMSFQWIRSSDSALPIIGRLGGFVSAV